MTKFFSFSTRKWTLWAFVSLCIASFFLRPDSEQVAYADIFLLIGWILLAIVLWRMPKIAVSTLSPMAYSRPISLKHILIIAIGIFCLGLLAERNGHIFTWRQTLLPVINIHGQVLLLIIGVICVIISLSGINRSDFPRLRGKLGFALRSMDGRIVLILILAAFLIRMWQIDTGIRAFMDEGPFITTTSDMIDGDQTDLLIPLSSINSFTKLFSYGQLLASEIFGHHITSIRIVSVIFGALSVGALYALARQLWDRPIAILAGVLLLTFPPHIHFSRIGFNNIADPLFGMQALLFFWQGVQTRKRYYYVLSGAMIGLLPYFYEGGELLYPPLLLGWAICLFMIGENRPSIRGILILAFTAACVAFPIYYTLIGNDLPIFSRISDQHFTYDFWAPVRSAKGSLDDYFLYFFHEQIIRTGLNYVHSPDESLFYAGSFALILPHLVAFFLMGIGIAFLHFRRGGFLILLWITLTILGNSLIAYPRWSARHVVVFPALVLAITLGLRYLWILLGIKRRSIAIAVVTVLTVSQLIYYFGVHIPEYRRQIWDLMQFYDVVYRIPQLDPSIEPIVIDDMYLQAGFIPEFYHYLDIDAEHQMYSRPLLYILLENIDNRRYGFFIRKDDKTSLDHLKVFWKSVDGPYYSPYDEIVTELQSGLYFVYGKDRIRRFFPTID